VTTAGPTSPELFTAETFQNEYLVAGAATVDAVVTVTVAGDPAAAGSQTTQAHDRAEIVIIDTSGSMGTGRKMRAVHLAGAAAVDALENGVQFAVLAGANAASPVWPVGGQAFAVATAGDRGSARVAIERLESGGGTAIGAWLTAAANLFATTRATSRHAILLTDGRNESQTRDELQAAVEACRGLFQCDCRGVGVDWEVEELRLIAAALLGTVDIVADPEDLADDFRAMISSSQSRAVPDVKLRVWAPQGALIESLRQVAPEILDLTGSGVSSGALTTDFLLGGWTPGEARDYHLRIRVRPGNVGDEMLAGRVSLVLGDASVATSTLVRAVWTDDTELSTRMDRHVAHYTGQEELADAIQAGLASAKIGDVEGATIKLGRAVELAKESGHEDTLRLLAKVVDIDTDHGTVRLRKGAEKAAEMTLDTRSSRTVRLGKPLPPPTPGTRA
jgi:hypothetical protein